VTVQPSLAARLLFRAMQVLGTKRLLAPQYRKPLIAFHRLKGPSLPGLRTRMQFRVTDTCVAGTRSLVLTPRRGRVAHEIFYLHGGGFILPITPFHWRLIRKLAVRLNARVTVPFYPLAPENAAPAIWDAVHAAYLDFTANAEPVPRTVMGDSSGGNLALSLVQRLRNQGEPMPDRVVLISPALDLTLSDPRLDAADHRDILLDLVGLRHMTANYIKGIALDDPRLSPLFGGLNDLPPLQVLTGARDLTHVDALRLRDLARDAGVPLNFVNFPDMIHVWPAFPIPEARQAIKAMTDFIAS